MFYSAEILSIRKKGKLSRIWLAATLSDRMFSKAVTKKVIMTIDIAVACDEILRGIVTTTENLRHRLSLYISSQLMYGTTKLFDIQVTMFQDFLNNVKAELMPRIDLELKKKKKGASNTVSIPDPLLIPDVPSLEHRFAELAMRSDRNLLNELTDEQIADFNRRNRVESPTFGELTDMELDFMLFGDNGDFRLFPSPEKYGGMNDASKEHRRAGAEDSTELHNLGVSANIPAIKGSHTADESSRLLKTPQKRPSRAADLEDTPTKRLRVREHVEQMDVEERTADLATDIQPLEGNVNLPEIDDPQPLEEFANLPENLQPADHSAQLPPEEAPTVPAAPQPEDATIPATVPEGGDVPPTQLEAVETRGKVARATKRIDKASQLPKKRQGRSLYGHANVHTCASIVLPPPERKRAILAKDLLDNPTSNRRSNETHSTKWADELIEDYTVRTRGPFFAVNDSHINAEVLRFPDLTINSKTAEISDKTGDTTGVSSKNQSAVEHVTVEHEPTAGLMLPPPIPEDSVPEVPMEFALADLPIPEHTNYSETEDNPREMEGLQIPQIVENLSESAPIIAAKLPRKDAQDSGSVETGSTANIDAFLPPKLRKRKSNEKRSDQSRSLSTDVIADIPVSVPVPALASPAASVRSECEVSSLNRCTLLDMLENLWRERRVVEIGDLVPVATTKKIDAVRCFSLLLELSKDKLVVLKQDVTFGPILITKRTASGSNVDWH